ncbi:MAG: phosphoglucosamine mutase [Alphaproteobacteria bacterium]|nr:phosphoglucosamine mutase [Alphaproteobacteria bacterium]
MTRKYFGTDGIRGTANTAPMTAMIALKVAMATAHVLRRHRNGAQTDRVIIGKDTRLSGYLFEEAMAAGFVSMGMDVILVGPIPTPGIAMLTRSMRADAGIMISASHNLFQDNGIKIFGADGFKLDDALEREIEAAIDSDLDAHLALPADIGKATRLDDALGRYVEHIKSSFPKGLSLEGLKVVVDCAHGAAYKVAPQVLWELEAQIITIGAAPNGRNINEGYGATAPDILRQAVQAHQADIGIALDGDADRLIIVDERGNVIDGDQLLAALALRMKNKGQLNSDRVISTVMSNMGLEKFLETQGIALRRTKVGDRYVVEAMRESGTNLGGEQSGHIVLSDYGTTGDGLLAALQILALIKESGQKASQALACFTPYPQVLKNMRFEGRSPLDDDNVQKAIVAAEKKLVGNGRLLVRPSGTEPLVRVMAEGEERTQVEKIVNEVCDVIAACVKKQSNAA